MQPENQTITVLIESVLSEVGRNFLSQLSQNLAAEARDHVKLVPSVVSSSEIQASLRERSWSMAILSTTTLKNAEIKTTAAVFEMPFLFSHIGALTALQQSPVGQAGLSTMSDQGLTGLVYLNVGLTLHAERKKLSAPAELRARTVAVYSQAQGDEFEKIGSVPMQFHPADALSAVTNGAVDSVAISSENASSWVFPDNGFLHTNSIRARVGMVVTQDILWNKLPFVYRAAIGDAAIAASASNDRALKKMERALAEKARSSGVSLVSFAAEDAWRATRGWISEQPRWLRDNYLMVDDCLNNYLVVDDGFNNYLAVGDYVKGAASQSPQRPGVSGQKGQIGEVYFATTREDTGSKDLAYRFGDDRTDVVKCGRIQYPQDDPTINSATLDGPVTADMQACGNILKAALHASKRMLIFIHGFNNRFSDALERAMVLKNVLGRDTAVVLWSWPSKRDAKGASYGHDRDSVIGIAQQILVEILQLLKDDSDNRPLDVLAHSMGAWQLLRAIEILSDENSWPNFRNIVFAAPDVPGDEFIFGLKAIKRVAKRNTLYACAWDLALELSHFINRHSRAGIGGSEIIVSSPMDSIDVDGKFMSKNHSYVFEAGRVRDDLCALVTTAADPAARNLDEVCKPPWHYWRFN